MERFERDIFGVGPFDHITPGTLSIETKNDDDLWTGASSKQMWFRGEGQDDFRLIFAEEMFLYISFFMQPHVRSLIANGQSKCVCARVCFFFFCARASVLTRNDKISLSLSLSLFFS